MVNETPLRYILVGTGGFGSHWCRAVLPRLAELGKATPAAAVDVSEAALANARDLGLPTERCYTDLHRALGENPADFAIIVVPPAHHETVVDAALAHDLHILSEKPLADSMPACCRIAGKVTAAGKKMAVTMSHRFDQDKQTLERAIRSGAYKRLHYVIGRSTHSTARFGSWGVWRHQMADPLLIEGGVHHLDILRALAGANAQSVYSETWNPPWAEYAGDSSVLVTIRMQNGVRCFYEGAWANASTLSDWGYEYFRAECEDGTLELDRRRLRVLRSEGRGEPVAQELPLLNQPVWTNPWLAELFCDWLRGGPAPPNQLEDNLQCAALLFAAIESARTGLPVDVAAFLQREMDACRP